MKNSESKRFHKFSGKSEGKTAPCSATLLVPAFSLGRSIYLLRRLKRTKEIKLVPTNGKKRGGASLLSQIIDSPGMEAEKRSSIVGARKEWEIEKRSLLPHTPFFPPLLLLLPPSSSTTESIWSRRRCCVSAAHFTMSRRATIRVTGGTHEKKQRLSFSLLLWSTARPLSTYEMSLREGPARRVRVCAFGTDRDDNDDAKDVFFFFFCFSFFFVDNVVSLFPGLLAFFFSFSCSFGRHRQPISNIYPFLVSASPTFPEGFRSKTAAIFKSLYTFGLTQGLFRSECFCTCSSS